MASALLAASRIEPSWGDRKVYMKNYNPNNTPLYDNNTNNNHHSLYPNPNPKPKSKQIHDSVTAHLHYRHDDDAAAAAIDEETASFVPRAGPNRFIAAAEYVTFNLGGLSRSELRELKKRLISELEQVRTLRTRLEAAVYESRSAYPSSQFSATARPSPESPRRKDEAIGSSNSKPKGSTQKKGSLGSKRVNPYVSDKSEQLKKPALESHGLMDNNQAISSMMKKCASILSKLMKHKHGWVFNTPVDVVGLGLHDYRQIIKDPMDLGTVKSNLDRDVYRSPREFASDVRLTFNNALTYNPKGHDVHLMAETLLQQFNQMFDPAYRKFEKERQKAASAAVSVEFEESKSKPRPIWVEESVPQSSRRDLEAMPVEKKSKPSPKVRPPPALSNQEEVVPSRQVSEPIAAPAPPPAPASAAPAPGSGGKRVKTHKLPKPKAKDPNKREMSFEEKAKLGMNLQSLPPEKMGQLLTIIRKRNKHFAQDGDEIELDIEAVDTETLWELDRFVCNYKKLASKIKRQGLINNQISASEITHKSPERESPEPIPQKGKKGETGGGEEDVDIGDEMPASDYPPVEIERDARSDSSSSSSSSSDSSSSDSDSRSSSSGSDSDADSVQSPFVGSKGGHGS